MKQILILLLLISTSIAYAQSNLSLMRDDTTIVKNKVTIGAYAQIDYNQVFGEDIRSNGKLDVHRMVMTMAYRFNNRTKFFTEIEYEHIKEVFVEQAYLSHRFNNQLNLRAGLMLIPMGIINEYHEPPIFNGVERPNVDKNIVPTTWREVGIGLNGRFDDASIKYQLYLVNGFSSYNDGGKLRGKDGLRKGRQKGAESFISSPNVSTKIDFYGISGLKLGLSAYFGKTQSSLFNGLDEGDEIALAAADSTVIDVSMIGFDARYNTGGIEMRGQFITASLGNTDQYNAFTGKDLGSALQGFYVEAGYNLLYTNKATNQKLTPFVRYESYNTHHATEGDLRANDAYNISEIVFGIGWKVNSGAVFKADLQLISSAASDDAKKQFNMGVGVMF